MAQADLIDSGTGFWNPQATPTAPSQPAQTNRWSYHLANDPYGGAAGQWAKSYYDNPNIDPNAAIKREVDAFRAQYGGAPADDRGVLEMIATGQRPQQQQTPMQSWSNPATQQAVNTAVNQSAENKARADSFWNQLTQMAGQAQNVGPDNPIVRAQTDAFRAEQERARRNYISEVAERYGPHANIQAEERMAADRAGNATASFQAQQMATELQGIRDRILFAMQQQGDFLSADRQMEMAEAVAEIEAQLRQLGLGQDWQRALMNNDIALRDLGFREWDRGSYYDLVNRGLII